jgi:DNA-binding NarL/FixJ family response regulator
VFGVQEDAAADSMQIELTPRDLDEMKPLISPREARLLALVRQGLTNREIATQLDVREQTVKNALAVLFQKCHVRNRTELAFTTPSVRLQTLKHRR